MPQRDQSWLDWGRRFRVLAKEQGKSLATVARDLDLAESTVRSWTNGTRQVNLSDFFSLCGAAGIDPSQVLFGRIGLTSEQKARLGELVVSVLDSDAATNPDYPALATALRRDLKRRQSKD